MLHLREGVDDELVPTVHASGLDEVDGYPAMVLSSPMAQSMYAAHGFRTLFHYRLFRRTPNATAAGTST